MKIRLHHPLLLFVSMRRQFRRISAPWADEVDGAATEASATEASATEETAAEASVAGPATSFDAPRSGSSTSTDARDRVEPR